MTCKSNNPFTVVLSLVVAVLTAFVKNVCDFAVNSISADSSTALYIAKHIVYYFVLITIYFTYSSVIQKEKYSAKRITTKEILAIYFSVNLITVVFNKLLHNSTELNDISLGAVFIFSVLFSPLVEEFVFRYLFVSRLIRYGETTAVLVSSLVFACVHSYEMFLTSFLFGVFLGCVFIHNGFLSAYCIHFVYNFSVFLNMIAKLNLSSYIYGVFSSIMSIIIMIAGILGFVYIIYTRIKNAKIT